MTPEQFKLHMEMLQKILDKLEEIRCGLIDVEDQIAAIRTDKRDD